MLRCFCWFFAMLFIAFSPGTGYCEMLFRFDMGTADSPLKDGYTRITPENLYSAKIGYGWAAKPAGAFDRTKSRCKAAWYQKFWGEQVVGADPYYGEPVDDLWRDGVADKNDLKFRVNIPNGTYNVYVTLGDEEWSRLDMNVAAEDSVVLTDVRTWIYWGAYPAHRRMMFRVSVKDKVLDLRFFNGGKDLAITLDTVETVHEVLNSVLAIEIEPYYPPRIRLSGEELTVSPELDSPGVRKGYQLFREGKYDDAIAEWDKIQSPRPMRQKGFCIVLLPGL